MILIRISCSSPICAAILEFQHRTIPAFGNAEMEATD